MRPRAAVFSLALACGGPSSGSTETEAESDTGSGATAESETGVAETGTGEETGEISPGHWETLSPLPGRRQETGVASMDGRVYVVGGFVPGPPLEVVSTVEVYDPDSDEWSAGPQLPLAVHHANTSAVGDTLFVTGFLSGSGFVGGGDVFALQLGEDAWQSRTPMPAGTERGGAGVAVNAGQVYLFGGLRDQKAVADVSTYLVQANSWLTLPELPAPRDHLVAGAVDGKLYVVTGRDEGIEDHSDLMWIFDPKTEEWSTATAAPTSRGGAAGAVHEGLFYVFGGEGNPQEASGIFGQAEVYDPLSNMWQALPDMPTPRHGTGAAAVGNRVHVPGGADVEAFGAVATHEAWVVGD